MKKLAFVAVITMLLGACVSTEKSDDMMMDDNMEMKKDSMSSMHDENMKKDKMGMSDSMEMDSMNKKEMKKDKMMSDSAM